VKKPAASRAAKNCLDGSRKLEKDKDRAAACPVEWDKDMMPKTPPQAFQDAVKALQSGRWQEAERSLRDLLRPDPPNFDVLNLLAVALMQQGKLKDADEALARALRINATVEATFSNRGLVLRGLNRPAEAIEHFDAALAINPNNALTLINRGIVYGDIGRHEQAMSDFDRALSLNPKSAEAFGSKGRLLCKLGRLAEALSAFDAALKIAPTWAEGWLGRGNTFLELQRHDDALSDFRKALALAPNFAAAWNGCGSALRELKRYDEALAAYEKALAIDPNLPEVWNGLGNVLRHMRRLDDAHAAFGNALALQPGLAEAWLGKANVFADRFQFDQALAAYDRALALRDTLVHAWLGRGSALSELKRLDEAYEAFDRAFALDPNIPTAEGQRLHAKMRICDWRDVEAESRQLIESVRAGKPNSTPFAFVSVSTEPDEHLLCARTWTAHYCPPAGETRGRAASAPRDKIRIAYLSAELNQHAVGYQTAGLFESHDAARFELSAISTAPDDGSALAKRIRAAFPNFLDATRLDDRQIADWIERAEIDILVDLTGHTAGARTGVFARRPAPLQVSYIGFPGTMGAPYIDYIVADRSVIPSGHEQFYTEKVVRLPHTYQVNDSKHEISERIFTREACGLPEKGFVFCNFNNSWKLNPDIFSIWMRILGQAEGSVLWLLQDNVFASARLKREASARGVDPHRLVFAPRVRLPDHLARLKLADLFLDTLPYNGHATTSGSLWAGLPVLTQLGSTFPGRVAASLLQAAQLPELITESPADYERLAIQLASEPARLSTFRERLHQVRGTCPLFDTQRFTRDLERAYEAMVSRHRRGLAPDHIDVAP
jgi:predicted O-linked N-acetylglucosamine transferase (SPINDLY family)